MLGALTASVHIIGVSFIAATSGFPSSSFAQLGGHVRIDLLSLHRRGRRAALGDCEGKRGMRR